MQNKRIRGKKMKERIKELLEEVKGLQAINKDDLESLRIKYLSKKGKITSLFNDFRTVSNEQKREVGQLLNDLKNTAQEKINELKSSLDSKESEENKLDLTRTPDPIELGTRHPLSIVKTEIADIFGRLGFVVAEGPEVEDDWHVFSALNFPPEHPARDMQDTFFIESNPEILLRTLYLILIRLSIFVVMILQF